MLASGSRTARIRSILIAVILGSLVCYCLGFVVLSLTDATRRPCQCTT